MSWLGEDAVTRLACALADERGHNWQTMSPHRMIYYRDKARKILIWLMEN